MSKVKSNPKRIKKRSKTAFNGKFIPFSNERDEMGRLFLDTKAKLKKITHNIGNRKTRKIKVKPQRIFRDKYGIFAKY